MLPVTVVVINYRTPDLTERAVRSLRRWYPSIRLLLIDNGSGDGSAQLLGRLRDESPSSTELLCNGTNLHHGPGMDQAARRVETPFVLFLDSDCEVIEGHFVEQMLELMRQSKSGYAVGKKIWMDGRGFDRDEGQGAHPYIRPICMLLNREAYCRFPPFEIHGSPCLANFTAASAAGLQLVHFPVEEYVAHLGRGTAGRHGYRLGLRGKINYFMHWLGL